MRKLFIIGLCLSFIGCAHLSETTPRPFVDPQYGMTKKKLIETFGRPDTIEIYKKTDQTRVEFYIYVKQYKTYQVMTPVCLIDNKIVGWGKSYYEDHVSADDIRIK